MTTLQTLAVYALAAVAEIAGCFAIWSWWRLEASVFWLIPGLVALAVFGGLLAQSSVGFAGRAYAAYGGVYVAASLVWLWVVEGQRPDRWDLIGAGVILSGTALILLAHREG